jgi:hypothetical protein
MSKVPLSNTDLSAVWCSQDSACQLWWSDRATGGYCHSCAFRTAVRSSLRDHRGGRWRARRQQSCPVPIHGEDQDAPKINALKAHRRDVMRDLRVNFSALRPPAVKGRLDMTRIPGHHQIRHQGERPAATASHTALNSLQPFSMSSTEMSARTTSFNDSGIAIRLPFGTCKRRSGRLFNRGHRS